MRRFGNGSSKDYKTRLLKEGMELNLGLMDNKVDGGIGLNLQLNGGIFNLMKNIDERIEAFLYEDQGELFINLYFRKFSNDPGKYSFILSHRTLQETESFFTISEKIKSYPYLDFLKQILNFPSVVVAGTFMYKNSLFILFRYHQNFKNEMNSFLNSYIEKSEDIRISEIRKPHTFRDRMMRINKSVPLAVLQTSSRYVNNELLSFIYSHSPGFIAELEGRGLTSNGIRALIYSEKELNHEGLTEISASQYIYEARHYESLFIERRRIANEERIPRVAILFSIKEERAFVTTFLPVEEMDNYMRIYSRTASKESGLEPRIEIFTRLREDVWNWLE